MERGDNPVDNAVGGEVLLKYRYVDVSIYTEFVSRTSRCLVGKLRPNQLLVVLKLI